MEKKEVAVQVAPELPRRLPTRLILCVDGTRYDPSTTGIQTNVYRIYASLKSGKCVDNATGASYNQVPKYIPGISAADDILSKDGLRAALPGQGYHQQIQDVYQSCCELTGEEDEVVFFGFSRGAYVARAVAGLLHHFGALNLAVMNDFARGYKKVLKEADRTQVRPNLGLSKSNSISSVSTASSGDFRQAPRIRFLGAFDTIKAVNDDSAFDISFNSSIQHLRHAVALHEDRKAMTPELIYPEEFYGTDIRTKGRSEIQAWFIGSHGDMGGSSPKSGLGLYPAQWMIFEANACGVYFDFEGTSSRGNVEKPLSVIFPKPEKSRKAPSTSSFQAANGVVVTMQDLRQVHDQPIFQGNYAIKLATRQGTIRQKKTRAPFDNNGYLKGYCDYAPQGTIIHPSVYLLIDEHINVALDTKEAKLQRYLEDWREKMLGSQNGVTNFGFWGDDGNEDVVDPGAIRVLVCGNTGVGKSTLINKTFGVDVTQSSDRSRGIHDVKEEIIFEGRPDLIVHDSGGFEAGADTEFNAIEEFLKEKSAVIDVKDRLHVIWFCIEINSARTMQTATEKLFRACSTYASEVPIVVVTTKKDDLLDLEYSRRRKELKKLKQPFDDEEVEKYAEEQLQNRLDQIRNEMESVPGGRLDALVAVSQDDDESIAQLSKTTSHCFDTDKVRLLYIRAQVSRIDLKVDMALCEVTKRYRALIRTASGVSFIPIGPSAHRRAAASKVCKAIMNCFGLPSVSSDAAIDALKKNVWTHLGFDVMVALAESLNTLAVIGASASGGMGSGALLISGAISIPLVVPATSRLFLTMATDLILVLIRSFREVAFRNEGQPTERDVNAAARIYRIRGFSQHVHADIKKLVPKRNVAASYKFDKIRQTVESMIEDYKDKLLDEVENLPLEVKKLSVNRGSIGSWDDDDDESTGEGSSFYKELKDANEKAVELEARGPLTELSPTKDPVELAAPLEMKRAELPADEPKVELEARGSAPRVHELQG